MLNSIFCITKEMLKTLNLVQLWVTDGYYLHKTYLLMPLLFARSGCSGVKRSFFTVRWIKVSGVDTVISCCGCLSFLRDERMLKSAAEMLFLSDMSVKDT